MIDGPPEGLQEVNGQEFLELQDLGHEGEKEAIRRSINSFPYWLANHCFTRNPRQSKLARAPAPKPDDYDWLYFIAKVLSDPEFLASLIPGASNRRLALPKSRQMFMTWFVMAWALWNTMFKRNFNTYICSEVKDDAIGYLDRARFMYLNQTLNHDMLKHVLYPRSPKAEVGTKSRMEWYPPYNEYKFGIPAQGRPPNRTVVSKMVALSGKPSAIRGKTASLVVFDEVAFQPEAEEAYGAIDPSLGDVGQIIFLSSANGKNFFWETVFDVMDTEAA